MRARAGQGLFGTPAARRQPRSLPLMAAESPCRTAAWNRLGVADPARALL